MDNRWLVKVNSKQAAEYLVLVGIHLYNRQIFIRHYDDVLAEEYNEYLEYMEHKKCLEGKGVPKMAGDGVNRVMQ